MKLNDLSQNHFRIILVIVLSSHLLKVITVIFECYIHAYIFHTSPRSTYQSNYSVNGFANHRSAITDTNLAYRSQLFGYMYARVQAVLKQTAARVGKSRIVRMIKQTELLRTNRRTWMIGLLRVEEATRGWRKRERWEHSRME